MNVRSHERKAISPIVATVLIVAATLIAFAAVAGYVFGIFGSAASTTNAQSTVASAVHGTATAGGNLVNAAPAPGVSYAEISLQNTGTGSSTVTSFTLTYAGLTDSKGGFSFGLGASGSATQSINLWIEQNTATVAGTAFTGSVTLANGEVVPFTGTFS